MVWADCDGIYKSGFNKYFKIKKKYTCHMPFWLNAGVIVPQLSTLIYRGSMWGGGEAFNFQKGKVGLS